MIFENDNLETVNFHHNNTSIVYVACDLESVTRLTMVGKTARYSCRSEKAHSEVVGIGLYTAALRIAAVLLEEHHHTTFCIAIHS